MKPLGIAGVSYADLAQPIDTGRNYVVGDKIGRWPLFAKHQAARLRRSACEEFVLLGPVERQIAFAQTRRGERDGEPALQDRVDEKRAQEGEVDQFLPYPRFRFRVRGAKSILGCPRLFCS